MNQSVAELLFPPENDPFAPKAAVATQSESLAGKTPDPLPSPPLEAKPTVESPQATQTLSLAEVLFGSEAERLEVERLGINTDTFLPDRADGYEVIPPSGWEIDQGEEAQAELATVKQAFHEAGLGQGMANDFISAAVSAAETPITITESEVDADLAKIYGSHARAQEKLGLARQLIAKAAKTMPSIYSYLNSNGLGNNRDLIIRTIVQAENLKKKGLL